MAVRSLHAGDLASAAADADAAVQTLEAVRNSAAGDLQMARARSLAHALTGPIWSLRGDAPRARAAWEHALAEIEPVARNSNDYQFLDPLAQALLALGRTGDAAPDPRKLDAMGYRNLRLVPAADQSGTRLPSCV